MLRNCLEEDVCLYRPNARWEGEFEWLKTFQGPQLENSRRYLSLGVRKPYKNCQTEPTSPHVIWEVSRKIILAHPKTNSSIFSYQTWLELQMGLASMVRWNEKKLIFSNKHSRWVTEHTTKPLQWPFLWPEPCRKWVGVNWREAPSRSWESKGSGVILDEGMVSDLLSGVL